MFALPSAISGAFPCKDTLSWENVLVVKDTADLSNMNLWKARYLACNLTIVWESFDYKQTS